MKALIKYLLLLCTPLVIGYNCLSGYTYEYSSLGAAQYYQLLIVKPTSSDTERKNYKIDAAENEVEEDELASSKKHLEGGNCILPISFSQAPECLFSGSKKILPYYTYFSNSSSCRYILCRAFRI